MRISDWSSDVCSSDLRKAADGLERHDARQRAIIGKAYGFQPMVEGADAEVAAQPFGDARPERIGIAAHGSTLCVMPMPIAAFCHAVPPPPVPSAPDDRAAATSRFLLCARHTFPVRDKRPATLRIISMTRPLPTAGHPHLS